MPRPTARVLALLEILQSGGTHTVAELARRVGVDERTLRRYAGHLGELGIPLEVTRGRYGGYRLATGYRMPPLLLTEEEALAVLLGLVAGRRAGLVTTSVTAAQSAAAKLRRVLPRGVDRRLDAIETATAFTAPPRPVVEPAAGTLLLFAEAVRDRRPVAVRYTSADGRHSERIVRPFGLVAHAGRWYVAGEDGTSGARRTFRVDRVAAPRVLDGGFDVPADFDAAAQVLTAIARAPHRHEVSVLVQGPADRVAATLPVGVATVEPADERPGWVRVALRVEELDWVPGVLAGLGLPFVVERPDALRTLVRALADRLAAATEPLRSP
ncbi:Predicted DNA-binding transcriptional regulator YafY, contains an HTH and WYL domains [Jatrophihabitans endophyticus]|uniref:Predicted DNA-binding transcriptional regulator YafY, contains an HTH and WYL domains n=1 Tax=Jatrophihabitans endophyticus TaxID=1206085 RepID=A0A1M5RKM9_9ACTN|nr:YafY family protein [Jatrophihabitans endophyticus]SHH26750.1 Predicted DNA-binding transcriptional regulator YafY, contains an HTH and WYL domains [Jatrophihabitans endophyticus]